MSKKFLLITPNNHLALGIRILGAILLNAGYEVQLIIFKNFNKERGKIPTSNEWKLLHQAINNFKPDFVGISLLCRSVVDEKQLFLTARNAAPGAIIVCGGFGPTFEPKRFLEYGFDYIVRGEGEKAILDMANALEKGDNFKNISNVGWLENGQVKLNPLAELIDLAILPHSLHGKQYIHSIENDLCSKLDPLLDAMGIYVTSTSRGCTSRCTYCCGGNWLDLYRDEFGKCKRYRVRPIENVINECIKAKNLGAKEIRFVDEYFVRPKEEYFKFFEEYKNKVNLPFFLNAHTTFMEKDEARLNAYLNAGVNSIDIGVQSASYHISKNIFNRPMQIDTQLQSIKKLYNRWVSVAVDFIVGHSLEEEKDFLETLDFVAQLPFNPLWPGHCYIQSFYLQLLPGAKIGELFPTLKNNPMSAEETEFRRRILLLRHIIKDNDEFISIYKNNELRKNPKLLVNIFYSTFSRIHFLLLQETITRLEGKKVYFYGSGQNYQIYKHMFRYANPQGIIIDQGKSFNTIDGLPVFLPDDVLGYDHNNIPIVIFSSHPGIITTKIMCNYPNRYTNFIPCYNAVYPNAYFA